MKRKEFIRIITAAMEEVEEYNGYTCGLIEKNFYKEKDWYQMPSSKIKKDYSYVFGVKNLHGYYIPINFEVYEYKKRKQVRLNALAMYLAQSLAFKTYKDL